MERYVRKQEIEFGSNEIRMDKCNLDTEMVKWHKSLKSNTSCGVAGVPAELLKSGTESLYELFRQIFERCLNGDTIPNGFEIGHISVIHKKGKKDEYENYRGITVLNIFVDYMEKL